MLSEFIRYQGFKIPVLISFSQLSLDSMVDTVQRLESSFSSLSDEAVLKGISMLSEC